MGPALSIWTSSFMVARAQTYRTCRSRMQAGPSATSSRLPWRTCTAALSWHPPPQHAMLTWPACSTSGKLLEVSPSARLPAWAALRELQVYCAVGDER